MTDEIVTIDDLLLGQPALEYLANKELPPKTAYRFNVLGRKIKRAIRDYELTAEALKEKYSRFDATAGEKGRWEIPVEKMIEFNQQFRELRSAEVDTLGKKLRPKEFISDLEAMGTAGDIKPSVFIDLWFIFEEE